MSDNATTTITAYQVPLDLIGAYSLSATAIPLDLMSALIVHQGYIAGTGDGIVTIRGHAAKREILVMDANTKNYQFVARVWSLANGHYLITGLDPNKQYMVMARDYNQEYEPFAWDYVKPADDLTINEQQALWAAWQQ